MYVIYIASTINNIVITSHLATIRHIKCCITLERWDKKNVKYGEVAVEIIKEFAIQPMTI